MTFFLVKYGFSADAPHNLNFLEACGDVHVVIHTITGFYFCLDSFAMLLMALSSFCFSVFCTIMLELNRPAYLQYGSLISLHIFIVPLMALGMQVRRANPLTYPVFARYIFLKYTRDDTRALLGKLVQLFQ